uniref:SAP domain-containing protein n=1 Tax=Spongospora subterranea TaxID=70186 RepID=A0A0H5R5S9_9EUKA|eukprot:CRZ09510.1 hypothetical protein [Spongospora subterranea]
MSRRQRASDPDEQPAGGSQLQATPSRSSKKSAVATPSSASSKMLVKELQQMLSDRGLETKGRKADLVARLVAYDQEQAEAITVDEPTNSLSASEPGKHDADSVNVEQKADSVDEVDAEPATPKTPPTSRPETIEGSRSPVRETPALSTVDFPRFSPSKADKMSVDAPTSHEHRSRSRSVSRSQSPVRDQGSSGSPSRSRSPFKQQSSMSPPRGSTPRDSSRSPASMSRSPSPVDRISTVNTVNNTGSPLPTTRSESPSVSVNNVTTSPPRGPISRSLSPPIRLSPSRAPRSPSPMARSPSPADNRAAYPSDRNNARSPSPEPSVRRQSKKQRRSRSRSRSSSSGSDRDMGEVQCPGSPVAATFKIRINNFVRPLRIDDVRALLSKFGNVTDLTMDKFKTHAIAQFDSKSDAATALRNLQGTVFQPESGKTLEVVFVNDEGSTSEFNTIGDAPPVDLGNGIPPPETHTMTLDNLFKKTLALPPIYWQPKKLV